MKNKPVSIQTIKNLLLLLVAAVLLLASVFSPSYALSASLDAVRVSLIEGDVQVKTEDTSDWVPASINMPLKEGDRLWVPDAGKVELQLKDGSYVRLNENSSLDVLTLDKDSFQFYFSTGNLFVNFLGLKDSVIQIDTALASVRAYDDSVFRIDAPEKGDNKISVFRGTVNAENKTESLKVDAKNSLTLGETHTKLSSLGPVDSWEKWNRERDNKLSGSGTSTKYVPEELKSYSSDFDNNGKWVSTRDYGNVWTPTVVVSDWAPYRVGRWVWMGGDYVWVSYEPWGWAPYHYGRWVYGPSIGWFWVPPARGAVYWGPGFVGWVYTPTSVAWVPLAPGELYYGRGYYGPGSVNVTNINIVNVHKTTNVVYKNVKVKNAVTVVNQQSFLTGKGGHIKTKTKDNPFTKHQVSLGSPNIKPEKATMMPVVKEIPSAKHPPKQIRDEKFREIREVRPLVKDKTVPVMKGGQKGRTKLEELANPEGPHRDKAPALQKQIKPAEKLEKTTGPVKKDDIMDNGKKPKKLKDSDLTPEEKQKLKQRFEKQTKQDSISEKQQRTKAPALETPNSSQQKKDLAPSEKQKLKKKSDKQESSEPRLIERQRRETRESAAEPQKEAAPQKPEHQKQQKKVHKTEEAEGKEKK